MTIWEEIRNQLKDKRTSNETTSIIYKKIATSGVNMLNIIKPSFYIGQMAVLSGDFMLYVDKFLASDERDWGEYLKFNLYIREISKKLISGIQDIGTPITDLIMAVEEIFEGESYEEEDYEDEPEPELVEKPEDMDENQILKRMSEDSPVEEENTDENSEPDDESKIARESMIQEHGALKEHLLIKFLDAETSLEIAEKLSGKIADVYLECIQLERELQRLIKYPEGDLASLLSILVDINFGLCHEMKRHLMEDIAVLDRFQFEPGLLTWTAHFLTSFSDKINEELKAN